jgi:hypothetical protein
MIYAKRQLANYLKQFRLVIVIFGRMSGLESKKNRKITKIKLKKFKIRFDAKIGCLRRRLQEGRKPALNSWADVRF